MQDTKHNLFLHRTFQYVVLVLILTAIGGGIYHYFNVRAAKIKASVGTAKINAPLGNSLTQGLAAYFKLDENTGTTTADASINAATGTLTNGPVWAAGQINYGVDFDGSDDFITTPDADVLDVTDSTNFTLSGWFNRDTFTTSDTIVAKSNGQAASDTGYNVYIDDATDKVTFVANDGTDQYKLESVSTFVATGWHHFTISWDDSGSTNTKFYIDGTPEAATATGTFANVNSLANAVAFRLGAESDNGNPFDGKLDEVRLYNRALSADEVVRLYQQTVPTGVDTSLVGYWSFDGKTTNWTSSTAAAVADLSGRGNTLTYTGLNQATTPVGGKIGQGFNFTSDTPSGSITSYTTGTTFTLAAWMYLNGSSGTYERILSDSTTGNGFAFDDATQKMSFYFSGNHTATNTTSKNMWHHVVFSVNAGTGTFYVDGTANGTVGSVPSIGVNTVGGKAFQEFRGVLDDVRIYNRALSAAEVVSLYNVGVVTTNVPVGEGLSQGLAAYFKLDENTGTTTADASVNAATGTLTNGPVWAAGQINYGVDFDGSDDFITTPDADVLDVTDSTNFTLSGWFNRDTFTTSDTIVAKSNGQTAADTGYNVYIDDFYDAMYFVANDGTDQYSLKSISTFTATGWHHFAISWDDGGSANTKLYIDGTLESATTAGTFANVNSLANAVAFRIGAESDGGNPFDGKLDDIRFYNRALSASEVKKLYQLGTPTGTDTSLVGYWSFDGKATNWTSSTAGTATDLSGKGNTGTLTNMVQATSPVGGKVGQALLFNGTSSRVDMGNVTAYNSLTSASGCAWVKHNSLTTDDVIMSKANAGNTGMVFFRDDVGAASGRTDIYTIFLQDSSGTHNARLEGATNSSVANVWTQVCFTMTLGSATGLRLYVNGVADANGPVSTTTVTDVNVGATAFQIGDQTAIANRTFDGLIDDVRLYNRVLSAAEVASLYNQGR